MILITLKKKTLLKITLLITLFFTTQLRAQTWDEIQKITSFDSVSGDSFGGDTAIDGEYLVIGATNEDEDEAGINTLSNAGAVYIFKRDTNGYWQETQKIVASDRTTSALFGNSVAINGNVIVIGAYNTDKAYIFEKDVNGVWGEVQIITASETTNNFGESVDIDNDYLIIGANLTNVNSTYNMGTAYVFKRDINGVWNEVQRLTASDGTTNARFGNSVSIDGDIIAVGASFTDINTLNEAGATYIYEIDVNGIWNETNKLVASDSGMGEYFGCSVSIDNNYLVIGAYAAYVNSTITNAGSAYVYERNGVGNWQEKQIIEGSHGGFYDHFGFDVAVNGNHIIVGAKYDDEDEMGSNPEPNAGSVYIYERNGAGNWLETQKIVASDRVNHSGFGENIAIQNDEIIVGRPNDSVYFFKYNAALSVSDNFGQAFQIYPNPTMGSLKIDLGDNYKNIKLSLVDVLGRVILTKNYNDTKYIDMNVVGVIGTYFVRISTIEGKTTTLKVIKN